MSGTTSGVEPGAGAELIELSAIGGEGSSPGTRLNSDTVSSVHELPDQVERTDPRAADHRQRRFVGEKEGMAPVGHRLIAISGVSRRLRSPSLQCADAPRAKEVVEATDARGEGWFLAPRAEQPVNPGPVPTFSVVIAAYEAADFVGDAVASALGQTVSPVEVVVCDDGSTDDIEGALRPDRNRITLIRQENRGEGAAKNAAARAATGDFISILDADDVYLPERNELLGKLASQRPDLDMITSNCLMESDGEVIGEGELTWRFMADDQRSALLRENFLFGNLAVRRSRFAEVGGFDESITGVADWDLWLRLVYSGSRVGYLTRPLARCRIRRESLSSDRAHMERPTYGSSNGSAIPTT